ncbi:PREDICTED: uncharacterized protein LOC101313594 [Fragaria vesca subsp. vesca]
MPCGNPNCSCGSSCSCGDDCKCGRTGLSFSENTVAGVAPLKMYYEDSEMNFGEGIRMSQLNKRKNMDTEMLSSLSSSSPDIERIMLHGGNSCTFHPSILKMNRNLSPISQLSNFASCTLL